MKQISVPDLNIVGELYESIDEFYQVNDARSLNSAYEGRGDYSAKRKHDVTDNKEYTWEETRHDMRLGSELFDKEFEKVLKEVEDEVPSSWKSGSRNRSVRDVVGQNVVVERAMVGHPKAFSRKKPQRLKQKTVTFFFSISCPWHTKTHDRLKSGVILMAICEHLERMGYQTRILYSPDFSFGNRSSKWDDKDWPSMLVQFCLKDFKTRFNLKKMQFPLASKSALFQVGCYWNHRAPMQTKCWGDGEGYAVDNDSKRLEAAREYAKRQDAVYLSVPMMRNDFNMDVKKIYDYVMKQIGAA